LTSLSFILVYYESYWVYGIKEQYFVGDMHTHLFSQYIW
jgi:hypothetical protein